jgi:CobQ-like glutamine amidotransferase family enzyme
MELRIAYLYPELLNIYGDRGNILTLAQRCKWRGIDASIHYLGLGDGVDPDFYDLYFMGGGQDTQQIQVCDDLQRVKKEMLNRAAHQQAVFLTICGGYQLLGNYYKPHEGPELKGLSLIDAYTVAGNTRHIGNMVIERKNALTGENETVVGFENHSGLTYLGPEMTPLGTVKTGSGNNGKDGSEGIAHGNLYGTYLHGSLLPKNPLLADELLLKALSRRYPAEQVRQALLTLDDTLEHQAHNKAEALRA